MPLERTIVASIVRAAERLGWYTVKLHGGPMQKAGIPDLLCLRHGLAVFLEVKQPGLGKRSEPTPLQRHRMAELVGKGGVRCSCVHDADEAVGVLTDEERAWGFPPRLANDGIQRAVDRDAVAAVQRGGCGSACGSCRQTKQTVR